MNELTASDLASGKGHKDENFPVASWLVRPDARAPIMAYYRFARASDDVADDESTSSAEKLRLLAHMRAGLDGKGAPEAMALGDVCRARGSIWPMRMICSTPLSRIAASIVTRIGTG
jgi:phytoene/squalene synthetase